MANAWYDYLASYNDLMDAFGSDAGRASSHYQEFGQKEGRSQDNFDEAAYLAANPDVAADPYYKQNAAQHYVEHGRSEGRALPPAAQSTTPASRKPLSTEYGNSVDIFGDKDYEEAQKQGYSDSEIKSWLTTNKTKLGEGIGTKFGLETQNWNANPAAAASATASATPGAAAATPASGTNYAAELDKFKKDIRDEYEDKYKNAKSDYDTAVKNIGDSYNSQISSFNTNLKTYQDLANKYQGEVSNLGIGKKAAEDRATALQGEFDAYKKKSETDAADSQLSALRGGYQAASGIAVGGGADLSSGAQVANRGASDRPGSVVAKLRIDPTDSVLDKGDVVQSLSGDRRQSSAAQMGGARRDANLRRQEAARYYSGRFGG